MNKYPTPGLTFEQSFFRTSDNVIHSWGNVLQFCQLQYEL